MRRPLVIVSIVLAALLAVGGVVTAGITLAATLVDAISTGDSLPERQIADDGGFESPGIDDDPDFGTVEVYDVLENGTLTPAATGTAGEVWNLFVRLAGAEAAGSSILQFRAGDAPESDTLAYVLQDRDPQYWTLVVNLAIADDVDLIVATLVHEYAHVLSYGPTEFDAKATSCPTFEVVEGCAEPDSYLWAFYDEFWAGYDEHPDLENVDPDIAYDFYLEHEDDFVSDYAATNIGEDFAESFMAFVIEDAWSTDTVIGSKLEFFAGYPEFVALREQMRAAAAPELGL